MSDTKKELWPEGIEEYPVSTVIIENIFIVLWLILGAYLCWVFSSIAGIVYLAFGLFMVLFVMRIFVCKNCYYHGKLCHTGWGKLSALYTDHGNEDIFCRGAIGAIVPAFYGVMALIPLIFMVISLIRDFTIMTIIIGIVFLFISSMSSIFLRKKACEKCKMKIVCPGNAAS